MAPSFGINFAITNVVNSFKTPSSAPATPILDTITGAGAAYSLRKLRTAYAGSAIRVRRSSDNTEQDIGFSGNDLDTAALSTFVGANSGFVVTWYDQSGNARNFTQSTAANQPRIVNAGVLETEGGLPSTYWDSTDVFLNTSPFMYAAGASTMMCVIKRPPDPGGTATHLLEYNTGGTARYRVARSTPGTNTANMSNEITNDAAASILALNVIVTGLGDSTLRHFAIVDTGSSIRGHLDGTLSQTRSYTRSGSLTMNQTLMAAPTGTKISEMIIYPSALSNADFNTVGANQGEAYGITVNPI